MCESPADQVTLSVFGSHHQLPTLRQALCFPQFQLPSVKNAFGSPAFHVAAIDDVSVPDGETGQQSHHRDDHQADHAPLGVEASGKCSPPQRADHDRNDDGSGQQTPC